MQESMGNTEFIRILSLCKADAGRRTVETIVSGFVDFCGKAGKRLLYKAYAVWKTVWKMFITYCTRKLSWTLCELIEQTICVEGYRSLSFFFAHFAIFVEYFRNCESGTLGRLSLIHI